MNEINKVVRVGLSDEGNVYCKIKYKDGKLSITGVIGPMSNGNAKGPSGQISDYPWRITKYAPGWDDVKMAKFLDIWDMWHLNDMKPYSPEMAALGWDKLASRVIYKHAFSVTTDVWRAQSKLRTTIINTVKRDGRFIADAGEEHLLRMPDSYNVFSYSEEAPTPKRGYGIYGRGAQKKTLGWVSPSEHPDGLLGKKVNQEDKYGYGTEWWTVEVPEDVLEWLNALPDTDKTPAWV